MDKKIKTVLSLPAVRFAPFFAAGLIAVYFTDRTFLVIPAAVLLAAAVLFCRKAAVSAAGLYAGTLIMSLLMIFYVAPIRQFDGQTVRSRLFITEVTGDEQDTQQIIAQTDINGVSAAVRLRGDFNAKAGDTVEADVEYYAPADRYSAADNAAGIFLHGNAANVSAVSDTGFDIRKVISDMRGVFVSRVKSSFEGDDMSVVLSMMFGEDSALSAEMYEALCVSGVMHYTAVSGTHLSIIAAVIIELFLGRKGRASAVISMLTVPIGILFFNGSLSVIRAGLMLLIYYSAPLLGRQSECLNTLCAAATAIMFFSPFAAVDAGFAMSVLGVFGAAVVSPRIRDLLLVRIRRRVPKKIAEALLVSVCAAVCTAPVSVGVFGGISFAGVFVSAVLLPFMTVGMTLVYIGCLTGMGFLMTAAYPFVKVLSALPAFVGEMRGLWAAMDFWGAAYLAGLSALMLTGAAFLREDFAELCGRMFALLTAFSLAMPLYSRAQRHEIVFACSSGSAAAAVCIENEAYVLISGTGAGISETAADCLRRNGITHIRCISAPDADFRGSVSVAELGRIFGADTVITSASAEKNMAEEIPSADVRVGMGEISLPGLTIASARINEPCGADIVLYYGHGGKITQSGSGTAVYFSLTQDKLPENGVNIYGADYRVALEEYNTVTLK